jgi:uncharacterized protein (DUF362 family)
LSIVSIVKGNDSELMVSKAVELLGGLSPYVKQGQKVFIKPNVCGGVPGKPGSFTSPGVLSGMIKLLRKMDAGVFVGESDSSMYTADVMLPRTGVVDVATENGAEVVNLSRGDMVKIDVPNGYSLKSFLVNKAVREADAIRSMPVMKTHTCNVVSLGMKTMLGILPERKKGRHHSKLDQVIVDVVSALPPQLTIIDATKAMEGQGPFEGEPIQFDIVVAGNNVVSTDACAAMIMGIDPPSIYHLRLASKKGLGPIDLKDIEVRGDPIEKVRRAFRLATPIKIDRIISRVSGSLSTSLIHWRYERAVKSWEQAQQKSSIA